MALSLFGLFIAIIAAISFFRKRHDRHQQKTTENFWDTELEANHVRRQDISGLPYINIPFEDFSIGAISDETLNQLEASLETFRNKKILNLAGQTNTDLKLLYGPANLPVLTECDQNFTDMLCLFTDYANRLIELEQFHSAAAVLEFCVETGSDVTAHYTLLADYYKTNGQEAKLNALHQKASALDSLMKNSILQKLDAIIKK